MSETSGGAKRDYFAGSIPYRPSSSTDIMSNTPRFGKSSSFADMFHKDTRKDYLYGLLFGGILLVCIFLIWTFILIIFKFYFGKKKNRSKYGFLSGKPFTITNIGNNNDNNDNNGGDLNGDADGLDDAGIDDDGMFLSNYDSVHGGNNKKNKQKKKKSSSSNNKKLPFRIRTMFLLAGVTLIIFSCLLVTKGITNLRNTILIVDFNGQRIRGIVNEAEAISASLRAIGQSSANVRDELIDTLGNFCPSQKNLTSAVSGLMGPGGFDFDMLAKQAIDLLTDLDDFLDGNVQGLESTLQQSKTTIDDVMYVNENYVHQDDWQILLVFVPLVTITSVLMTGAVMASFEMTSKRFTCLVNYIFLPLFVLMSFVSYCGAGAVLMGAALNADWCSGGTSITTFTNTGMPPQQSSPDGTMLDIMKIRGMNETSLGYQVVDWYVKQCDYNTNDPWLFIRDYESELKEANTTVSDLSTTLKAIGIERLTQICGGDQDFGKFDILLQTMRNNLRILFESAYAALRLLRCDRVVPIYTSLAYDGTCQYSITGFTWIWSSLLVIAFCSMIMIMFRSSMQETVIIQDLFASNNHGEADPFMDGDDDDDEPNNNSKKGRRGRQNFIDRDGDNEEFYDEDDFQDEEEDFTHYDDHTNYDDGDETRASSYRDVDTRASSYRGGSVMKRGGGGGNRLGSVSTGRSSVQYSRGSVGGSRTSRYS